MELTALIGAIEVLTSPLEQGGQDAWLAECARRVSEALGATNGRAPRAEDLEELLRLPGDEPGWLGTALEGGPTESRSLSPADAAAADPRVIALRCALSAGLASLARVRAWRSTLGHAFDDVDAGMAVFTGDGVREVVRNARWDQLLEEELQRDRLMELVAQQAARAAGPAAQSTLEVYLAGGGYRLVANRVVPGVLLDGPAVLVLLDRPGAELPTTRELRISYGLRGREPQVALLAAEGLSNADIARRLRLSAHTVRHYLERVMDRLGLHSRKALAMRLMAGGVEPREPSAWSDGHSPSPRLRR